MYWTLKTIPELSDLSPVERRTLWRACWWSSFRHWQVWMALLVCGMCAALGGWLGDHLATRDLGTIGAVLGGGIGGFIFGQVAVAFARRYLREARDQTS